jgi:SAM-dependent methyltransferase
MPGGTSSGEMSRTPKVKSKQIARNKASAPRKKAAVKPKIADIVDRHLLYQASVQVPEADIDFFVRAYKRLRKKDPQVMREDFCGTGFLSCEWAKSGPKRRSIGIDLDEPTLAWGRAHNLSKLPPKVRDRVTLIRGNVLDGVGDRADITCALNFSYGVFKTRELLQRYFEVARECLVPDGVFITELYGGTEAIIEIEDEREVEYDAPVGNFTYRWEQAAYNPITHDTLCHIHFDFKDGSKLDKAFTYDWRLWTIPELRELLLAAGFRSVDIWWEGVDDDGEGSGDFHPTEREENQESWLVYIVAAK